MYLGQNINFLRKRKKLSQSELGELLGVRHTQIGAYEAERSFPRLEGLLELCKIFDVNVDDILHKDLSREDYRPAGTLPSTETEKEELARKVNKLLEHRVRELEREILVNNPELAKKLGIDKEPL